MGPLFYNPSMLSPQKKPFGTSTMSLKTAAHTHLESGTSIPGVETTAPEGTGPCLLCLTAVACQCDGPRAEECALPPHGGWTLMQQ